MRVKKKILLMVILLAGFLFLFGCSAFKNKTETTAPLSEETREKTETAAVVTPEKEKETVAPGTAYIRDILFGTLKGKERISLLLSEISPLTVNRDSENVLLLKLEKMFVPQELRKRYGEGRLSNLNFVLPFQRTEGGEKLACIKIAVKKMVPYRVKKDESGIITIDFDVSSLPPSRMAEKSAKTTEKTEITETYKAEIREEMAGLGKEDTNKYIGKMISLELQPPATLGDAFWTISEVSGLNIIATPEVQDTKVTLRMKKIPWDQALDTILGMNGLAKKQTGTVIKILSLEKLKFNEKIKKDDDDKISASIPFDEEQHKRDILAGRLRQISIEAKFVEANTSFSRQLGVLWGGGFQGGLGSSQFGMMMGSAASGTVTSLPNNIGLTGSNTAVNFPSSTAAGTPAIGMLLGSGSAIISAKLSALESTGDGKIISSPKVVTVDNGNAIMKQGEEIPERTTYLEGGQTITHKEQSATLKLEVTPQITPDGKISMDILATNDTFDRTYSVDDPTKITNSVESTVVVNNGDTVVIGGIYKITEDETEVGVPYLSKIPVLGWLFKYQSTSKVKKELLVFITPRIIE